MRIIGLDLMLPDERFTNASFSSSYSIFEFDVAIWNPPGSLANYSRDYPGTYRGLPSLDENGSSRLLKDMVRRQKELKEFVEMGRTLVIASSQPVQCYFDTGKRETSGTGRNQKVTRIVKELDLLTILPYEFESTIASGEAISAVDQRFMDLFRKYDEWWSYDAILTKFPGVPLAVVSGTQKAVGSIGKLPSGATVIHLPDCALIGWEYSEPGQVSDVSQSPGEGDGDGEHDSEDDELYELASALIDWIKDVGGVGASELPDWLEAMQFHEDIPRADNIKEVESQISTLETTLSEIQEVRAKDSRWKQLVSASGDALESIVEDAFSVLGFEVLDKVPGRRDLRLKSADSYAVVEIKGVSKSAAEANAAQLEKWVNEAFIEHEIHHKGILVVNTWRNLPLTQRTSADFPHQMLSYSTARNHVLITGLQLLVMVRAVLAGRNSADELRREILTRIGEMPGWSDFAEVFSYSDVQIVASGND